MAEVTKDSFPNEYDRPQVYKRPYGGIVAVMEKILKDWMTQTEATPNTPES